jgi:hypothetical protein
VEQYDAALRKLHASGKGVVSPTVTERWAACGDGGATGGGVGGSGDKLSSNGGSKL